MLTLACCWVEQGEESLADLLLAYKLDPASYLQALTALGVKRATVRNTGGPRDSDVLDHESGFMIANRIFVSWRRMTWSRFRNRRGSASRCFSTELRMCALCPLPHKKKNENCSPGVVSNSNHRLQNVFLPWLVTQVQAHKETWEWV
jgi:hypothetical protein